MKCWRQALLIQPRHKLPIAHFYSRLAGSLTNINVQKVGWGTWPDRFPDWHESHTVGWVGEPDKNLTRQQADLWKQCKLKPSQVNRDLHLRYSRKLIKWIKPKLRGIGCLVEWWDLQKALPIIHIIILGWKNHPTYDIPIYRNPIFLYFLHPAFHFLFGKFLVHFWYLFGTFLNLTPIFPPSPLLAS